MKPKNGNTKCNTTSSCGISQNSWVRSPKYGRKHKGAANCSYIFYEFKTWALCHANPLKKPKLPKHPPETNPKFPTNSLHVSFLLLLNHLIWIQFVFSNFYSEIHGKILKFEIQQLLFRLCSSFLCSFQGFRLSLPFRPLTASGKRGVHSAEALTSLTIWNLNSNFWDGFKSWKVSGSKVEKHINVNIGLLIGGWTNLSEKYDRQNGNLPQIVVKIKHIWNHHPD